MQCQVKKGVKSILNLDSKRDWLTRFYDFGILEDCLSKKNFGEKIGLGYERPNSDVCPDKYTFLAGSKWFQVSEFEVYQVPQRKL